MIWLKIRCFLSIVFFKLVVPSYLINLSVVYGGKGLSVEIWYNQMCRRNVQWITSAFTPSVNSMVTAYLNGSDVPSVEKFHTLTFLWQRFWSALGLFLLHLSAVHAFCFSSIQSSLLLLIRALYLSLLFNQLLVHVILTSLCCTGWKDSYFKNILYRLMHYCQKDSRNNFLYTILLPKK